ncbi:Alpha-(1,6)-fucosyltransferase [Toxocara canis]|uniref:Alpha-(1,6)-fucosyltransferase n=1 Tax=Toxocara canis TaxID=6265 RepID=A0A0B2W106_TOXCA|nr:Alpha-(1,6)-fucosyltransferase [Toxocara canis]
MESIIEKTLFVVTLRRENCKFIIYLFRYFVPKHLYFDTHLRNRIAYICSISWRTFIGFTVRALFSHLCFSKSGRDVVVRMQQLGCSMRRAALAAVAIWVLILVYLSISIFTIQSKEATERKNEDLFEKYGKAMNDVELLREQNEELRRILKEKEALDERRTELLRMKFNIAGRLRSTMDTGIAEKTPHDLFSNEHEVARRDLDNSIRELFFYLNSQFEKKADLPFAKHTINQMLSLLGQSAAFSDIDGAARWREAALADISAKMQSRLDQLQNPADCSSARALICQLNKGCGFGCQLHHVAYCFIVAYGTNRTLIMLRDGRDWNYSKKGWTAAFRVVQFEDEGNEEEWSSLEMSALRRVIRLPIVDGLHGRPPFLPLAFPESLASDLLKLHSNPPVFFVSQDEGNEEEWSSLEMSALRRVIRLPIVDGLHGRPPFLPLAFPESLASDLLKLHSNPPVFFVSQFMRYLMRPNDVMAKKIADAASGIPFNDELRRLAYEDIFIDFWMSSGREIQYPNYEVYGDAAIANSAQTARRYSVDSLFGVVVDIEMLARCTYLVCTFSSQVCRMGYELMQIRVGDAGDRFHSLDDLYYYGGQQAHEQVVVEAYKAESIEEINIEVGDVIGVAGNHWDGFSKGVNRRTGMIGLYPSYKVREKWIVVPFP